MPTTLTVHVILPSGTRFEHTWSDQDAYGNYRPIPSDDKILRAIVENKQYYGRTRTIKRPDEIAGLPYNVEHNDNTSPFMIDHPDTIVAIVEKDHPLSNVVREVRRLKGPPIKTPESPSVPNNQSGGA